MFACLLLPNFRLQAALRWRESEAGGKTAEALRRSEPEGESSLLVSRRVEHGSAGASPSQNDPEPFEAWGKNTSMAIVDGGLLVEVNDQARERGIAPGMTNPQAMGRDGEIRILFSDRAQEDSLHDLLLDQGLRLSPEVERTAPGVITVDLRRAAQRMCWQQMADGVVVGLRDQALEVRVGVAGTPDLAHLAAEGARPSAVVYQAATFVAALPLEALHPSGPLRMIFQDWGLRTVGDLLRLPRGETISRLGAEGEELLARISGRHQRPLRLVRTAPEYRAAYCFEYEVATTEPLLFLLRRFLEELTGRLRAAHQVAREMELRIPLDDGTVHERNFVIPAPTSEIEGLFRIVQTHLESLRLRQCPVGVQLRLVPVDPSRDQLRLFDRALRDPNQFGETLARLKALLGNDQVGVPVCRDTHEPDQFAMRAMFSAATENQVSPPAMGLPLRRYRPAKRIQVEVADGRPVRVSFRSAAKRVRQWAGPFRLSGHWWEAASWAVEEWDVGLENGGRYRLGRRGPDWTVEGCYDVC